MKARLSRPKRSISSVAWEGRSGEARASKARAARVRARAQRKRRLFVGAARFRGGRWQAGRKKGRRAAAPFLALRRAFGSIARARPRSCCRSPFLPLPALRALSTWAGILTESGCAARSCWARPRLRGPPGLTRFLARFARLGSAGAFSRSMTPAKAHSQRSTPNHEAQNLTPHSCAHLPKPRPGYLPR